jgi:hypothetical protein
VAAKKRPRQDALISNVRTPAVSQKKSSNGGRSALAASALPPLTPGMSASATYSSSQQVRLATYSGLISFLFSFGSLVLAARLDLLGVVSGIAGQSALNQCICVCVDILLYRVPSLTQNINLQDY